MDWQSGTSPSNGTNVHSNKTWIWPVTVNRYSHHLCCKAVKGAIRTSLLTADCHQQFATSPKQSYSHFLNGLICQNTPLVCQMTPVLSDKWRLHYCNSCCPPGDCLRKKDGWYAFQLQSAMPITTNCFYAEWNSGSALEKLELLKRFSDRIM